jgi:hypothetical protein
MDGILVVLFLLFVPLVIAFPIAFFTYKLLVKRGHGRPKRVRNIVFFISYSLLILGEAAVIYAALLSFER